jgi:hypothetical protein
MTGPNFSFWARENFVFFFLVPNVFPQGSPSSQVFPQDFPNSTNMVCLKFNFHVYKPKMWATGEHICFYFVIRSKEVLQSGSAQCSKKIDDEPINMVPSTKINK